MTTDGRERAGGVSDLIMQAGEKLAEVARRLRVEAVKAVRIGRIRVEMLMLRRDRRAALLRLGEAAHLAVREGRVADPALAMLAREVDDVTAAHDAKRDEIARIEAGLDEAERERTAAGAPGEPAAGEEPVGSIPVTRRSGDDETEDREPGGRPGARGGSPPRVPPAAP